MPYARIERYVENVAVGVLCRKDGASTKQERRVGLLKGNGPWPKLNQVVQYRPDSKATKTSAAFGTVLDIVKVA